MSRNDEEFDEVALRLQILGQTFHDLAQRRGRQFAVFVFDWTGNPGRGLRPGLDSYGPQNLPMNRIDGCRHNWNAAWYVTSDEKTRHRRKEIFDDYDLWIENANPKPKSLWVYSYNCPCNKLGREGYYGKDIIAYAKWSKREFGLENVYVGFDRANFDRPSVKSFLSELEASPDSVGVEIRRVPIHDFC
mmetsp:Transcript_19306/g.29092  ORF Transcript_19306/g.29092 Transcript_19306/m.29092 type:complete len:189 (-) Transcript_19306:130-696(-)|eukprot:CAMPEP_0178913112 /NCGR_PEP_ID=MMETSP0786-20121207/10653_1 /TAXON_ID=186022 /ORGANISM="Thalassionema frauenfeldii, Strain CCMP 1798" /LENGTH=188 /DNA_ID=CAMNT_0020585801 /DNA_START=61 /DNA_END=627 /DNA_ORIENTATION=+